MCIPHHKIPKLFLKANIFTIAELASLNRLKKSYTFIYISKILQMGGKYYCYSPSFSQLILSIYWVYINVPHFFIDLKLGYSKMWLS